LRIGEALAIDIKDINFADREIFVHTAKGGEGDKVYISDRMDFWLKKYLEQRKDNCPALFVIYFFEIRRLKKCQARRNLAGYRNEFGITKRITHHAFRRGFCTHLLNQGATIKEVQYLARHRSERTTLRFYCKVEKGKVKNVHERIFGGMPFQKTESAVALARGLAPEPALESVQE
jgi:integrase/recombinase XerD